MTSKPNITVEEAMGAIDIGVAHAFAAVVKDRHPDSLPVPEVDEAALARYIQNMESSYDDVSVISQLHFTIAGMKWAEFAAGTEIPRMPYNPRIGAPLYINGREGFLHDVASKTASLPEGISKLLYAAGYTTIVVGRLADWDFEQAKSCMKHGARRSFEYACGYMIAVKGQPSAIFVAQNHRNEGGNNEYIPANDPGGTVLHELGHGLSYLPTIMSDFSMRMSDWGFFAESYKRDCDDIQKHPRDTRALGYFMPDFLDHGEWSAIEGAREEAFAQVFADNILGVRCSHMRKVFANCARDVDRIVDAIEADFSASLNARAIGLSRPILPLRRPA